ncbi:MAG: pantetheine-phosphate adenylyltransferase, partial [Candidatus Sericytochromatia bacterium]|nr:pantetheine-phosphate adenylyltransferase [Candidatus Sericytochromatia bacterium]
DILERASRLFDEVIVAILVNTSKRGLFTQEERLTLLRDVTRDLANVRVEAFSGLTAEYARQQQAHVLIRGLRAVSDFDSELRLALTNKKLNPGLETVFLMTSAENLFLSSSTIKELVSLGGSPEGMVPPAVVGPLVRKLTSTDA